MASTLRNLRRRYFCPNLPVCGPARLSPGESRHLSQILRASPGDTVELVDGRGRRGSARFRAMEGDIALLEVISSQSSPARRRVGLAAPLLGGDRGELLIRAATEAGMDVFFPILGRRGTAGAEAGALRDRWERIAWEASRWSGRAEAPEILTPRPLAQALVETRAWPARFYADPAGPRPGRPPARDSFIFVGPEGGWTPPEIASLAGLLPLRLSPYTLHVETVALLAVAALANA